MPWPDDAPDWLVREAEREHCEIRWAWQEDRLAVFDELRPAYNPAHWLYGIFGMIEGEYRGFGYRVPGEDLNVLLDLLAKSYRPDTPPPAG